MAKSNVVEVLGRDVIADPLTELLRTGAEQLIYRAVEGELEDLLASHSERCLEDGKAGVVRNGYLPARELQTGLGPVTVNRPLVHGSFGRGRPYGWGAWELAARFSYLDYTNANLLPVNPRFRIPATGSASDMARSAQIHLQW